MTTHGLQTFLDCSVAQVPSPEARRAREQRAKSRLSRKTSPAPLEDTGSGGVPSAQTSPASGTPAAGGGGGADRGHHLSVPSPRGANARPAPPNIRPPSPADSSDQHEEDSTPFRHRWSFSSSTEVRSDRLSFCARRWSVGSAAEALPEHLTLDTDTQQSPSSDVQLDGLLGTLAEGAAAAAFSPAERLSTLNAPSTTGRHFRAQQRMYMRLRPGKGLLSIPLLSPGGGLGRQGDAAGGDAASPHGTHSKDDDGGEGTPRQVPLVHVSQMLPAPSPRRDLSPLTASPPSARRKRAAELPDRHSEPRRWSRLPPLGTAEAEAREEALHQLQCYEERLEHTFPCIPVEKPAARVPMVELLSSPRRLRLAQRKH